MGANYQVWAEHIQRLAHALKALEPASAAVGVAPPAGLEWYELLEHKLRPQVEAPPMVVAAVVGGTNIGKSVVFNHLAGEVASGVSPLASKTRHPVCLVPAGAADPALLGRLFSGFEVRPWKAVDDPWNVCEEHLLFWREGPQMPPRLLVLDTPDIDSAAEVNWQRADTIRHAADVLIAVLTQQKYNDAAVKQFFRKAAEADKPVIVVFNQVDLEEDREAWPEWLATFVLETGAQVQHVYVAPHDRKAAERLALPFLAVGPDGRRPAAAADLGADLAALHFDAIKIRTLRGAVTEVLDVRRGAPAYLAGLKQASGQFLSAAEAFQKAVRPRTPWPRLPNSVLVQEIGRWWDQHHRSPLSRQVNAAYRMLWQGVTWPARKLWQAAAGPPIDPLATFQRQEWEAILELIGGLMDELEGLAKMGNEILQPRLKHLLGGDARARLIERVRAAHQQLPAVDDDFRTFADECLQRRRQAHARFVKVLEWLDQAVAVGRPLASVSLLLVGVAVPGDAVMGPVAGHLLGHAASEATVAVAVPAGGEAAAHVVGTGFKQTAAALLSELQVGYAQRRAAWLAALIERELLGDLLGELRAGAQVAHSAALHTVEAALDALRAVV